MDGLAKLNELPKTFEAWSQWLMERGGEFTLTASSTPVWRLNGRGNEPDDFVKEFHIDLTLPLWTLRYFGVLPLGKAYRAIECSGLGYSPLEALERAVRSIAHGAYTVTFGEF